MLPDPFTLDLFEEPARARRTDPETSHEAAASIEGLTARRQAVLEVLRRYGPLTDEELVGIYEEKRVLPPQSPSGIRTRRNELVRAGLVEATDILRTTVSGRRAKTWSPTELAVELLDERSG